MFNKNTVVNFEGQFRRLPTQNLAGASRQLDRDRLLEETLQERRRREDERHKEKSALCIQAWIRSYCVRKKLKFLWRQEFDALAATSVESECVLLNELFTRFMCFYDEKTDSKRLLLLCRLFLMYRASILSAFAGNEYNCPFKLTKMLSFNVAAVRVGDYAIHFRMLEEFTNIGENVKFPLSKLFLHLVTECDYFQRLLSMAYLIPAISSKNPTPPNLFAKSVVEFIKRPLQLVNGMSMDFGHAIMEKFTETFLTPEMTNKVKYFILPYLETSGFPFKNLLSYLSSGDEVDYSSWLLYSILSLGNRSYMEMWNESDVVLYFRTLARLSFRIKKLGDCELYGSGQRRIKRYKYDSDISYSDPEAEAENDAGSDVIIEDSSDEDDDEYPPDINDGDAVIPSNEKQILEDTVKMINNPEFVGSIVRMFEKINQGKEESVKYLGRICYNLSLSAKIPPNHFFASAIPNMRDFLKTLWNCLMKAKPRVETTAPNPTMAGKAGTIVPRNALIITHVIHGKGGELQSEDVNDFAPLATTFVTSMRNLLERMDDEEFFAPYASSGAVAGVASGERLSERVLPLTLDQLSMVAITLGDVCFGILELAYPEARLKRKLVHENKCIQTALVHNQVMRIWKTLFEESAALLSHLYERDMRRSFCRQNVWSCHRFSTMQPLLDTKLDLRNVEEDEALSEYFPAGESFDHAKRVRMLAVVERLPFFLTFHQRVQVFQTNIGLDHLDLQGRDPYSPAATLPVQRRRSIDLVIRRNFLYEDAFEKLSPQNEADLRPLMRIQLRNVHGLEEAGIDGGGLFREFMGELLKTSFDPNRGFFLETSEKLLYPNPQSPLIHKNYAAHYRFVGRILGKALFENYLVDLPLADFFLSKLVNDKPNLCMYHLSSLDPELYKQLMKIQSEDVSDYNIDFTITSHEFGENKTIELVPNGANIPVTNDNKMEYLRAIADFKLNKQMNVQTNAFKAGLMDLISHKWLHMFSPKELQTLISGLESAIDLDDLKRFTKYIGGYKEDHATILLFWQVVESFDEKQRRLLLKFVTSCSRQPLFGFRDLEPPFTIHNGGSGHDADRLPSASTCMNLLKLPEYKTYDVMYTKLKYAVEANAGFELS